MTTAAARRMRRTRARRRDGKTPVTVVVGEDMVDQLVEAGLLNSLHADDKAKIAAALERLFMLLLRATPPGSDFR